MPAGVRPTPPSLEVIETVARTLDTPFSGSALARGTSRIRAAALRPVERPAVVCTPRIQRTTYEFLDDGWTATSPKTKSRFPHPGVVDWTPSPKQGDRYDDMTGVLDRATGKQEHVFDAADRKGEGYGSWWGEQREQTAYSFLSGGEGGKEQGPHTFAFIGKRAMAEAGTRSNPNFDPGKIRVRSAVIPSPGQNRALLSMHEEATGRELPKERKRAIDAAYTERYEKFGKIRANPAKKQRVKQVAKELIEMGALGTYALGRKATKKELKGKGERRGLAIGDLKLLAALGKGEDLPPDLRVFDPNVVGHSEKLMGQYGRAMGRLAAGDEEDLSEMEVDSESEYSDAEGDVDPMNLDEVESSSLGEDEEF